MTKKVKTSKTLDSSLPIFQLKITLEDINPPIWRRIQTLDCTLAELHEIIQSCMDWEHDHLHAFEIGKEQYTNLEQGADPGEFRDSRSLRLSKLVDQKQRRFIYEYDFGDSWRHRIEIEDALLPQKHVRYPRCLDGRRAGPPEDSGGPGGYPYFLDAIQDPDHPDHEERLEWIGRAFDPEKFEVDEVNRRLQHLRPWLGRCPRTPGQTAGFAKGDRIRAKRGVVHSRYPDIPLGGWVGTVTRIAWLIPISYEIRWAPETLAAAHPIYSKRCHRDEEKSGSYWLDEEELELDSAEQTVEMEQPTNLVSRPLSPDDEDDRIRMVFGLTSDDPLPMADEATEQRYREYLKAHLTFPFNADYWYELTQYSTADKQVTVVGLASESPVDSARGIFCEVRCEEKTEQAPLVDLDLDEDDPNCQYADDYGYWRFEAHESAALDEEDDGESWDEEDDEEYGDGDEDAEEDDKYDEDDFAPPFAGDLDDEVTAAQPIRREQPPVGRNDPCPCGSGKKFKKCCLKKQGGEAG